MLAPTAAGAETWPKQRVDPAWIAELNETFDGKHGYFHDTSYKSFLTPHQPFGDYLNYSRTAVFRTDGEIVLADDGLPMVSYRDQVYWNPVTLAQYALGCYGRFIKGDAAEREKFLHAVDKLVSLQSPDGGFRYPITFTHKEHIIPPGWVSAMAQGQALSVFARALRMEKRRQFRLAGERAAAFLLKPVERGGAMATLADLHPSLRRYIFFPEYIVKPVDYTLNGYIFTLLGLYDWSQVSSRTQKAFQAGVRTLERLLPYFDLDGFSTYDLGHIVSKHKAFVPITYEARHVYLLHAIQSVAPRPQIERYLQRWTAKLERMNATPRIWRAIFEPPSPQPAGTAITVKIRADADPPVPKLYQFAVKHDGVWTFDQPFSESDTFIWKPSEAGHYDFGLYVKSAASRNDYDNFRHFPFTVTPPILQNAAAR